MGRDKRGEFPGNGECEVSETDRGSPDQARGRIYFAMRESQLPQYRSECFRRYYEVIKFLGMRMCQLDFELKIHGSTNDSRNFHTFDL